jgi:hypothetical protein
MNHYQLALEIVHTFQDIAKKRLTEEKFADIVISSSALAKPIRDILKLYENNNDYEASELIDSIADEFEQYLTEKNLEIPCADADEEAARHDGDNCAKLYGMEYSKLYDAIDFLIKNNYEKDPHQLEIFYKDLVTSKQEELYKELEKDLLYNNLIIENIVPILIIHFYEVEKNEPL